MESRIQNIAILDTSILSFNLGDQIIMESCRKGLKKITQGSFVVNMPTHSPLFHVYEFSLRGHDGFRDHLNMFDLKFVCGTNLLEKNMRKRKNSWNIHKLDTIFFNDVILVGVGTDGLPELANNYTKRLYTSLLSHDFIHSVRDENTKRFLESIGIRAINTGCATLWPLTKEHCTMIPKGKSESVVFTLTDYCPNNILDKKLIMILKNNYKNIYFWPQGIGDINYFNSINPNEEIINVLDPSLAGYDEFLSSEDCDYIGTRLHAGIKAMQKFKRSIILGVDNRAKDMHETYGLNYLTRDDVDNLEQLIYSEFETDVRIDECKINMFLSQFLLRDGK